VKEIAIDKFQFKTEIKKLRKASVAIRHGGIPEELFQTNHDKRQHQKEFNKLMISRHQNFKNNKYMKENLQRIEAVRREKARTGKGSSIIRREGSSSSSEFQLQVDKRPTKDTHRKRRRPGA